MATLPSYIKYPIQVQESFDDTVRQFRPDIGPPLAYKISDSVSGEISFSVHLDDETVDDFLDWWESDADLGAALVDVPHPRRDAVTVKARVFVRGVNHRGANSSQVQIVLRVSPRSSQL